MCALAIMGMVGVSHALCMPEIMLPTFGALVTGTWSVSRNLWHYNKRRLFLSLAAASIWGSAIANGLAAWGHAAGIYVGVYVAFLGVALILIFGRTQIYPCFGAALLPVLFQNTSWFYPASVCTMGVLLCLGRAILERFGFAAPLNPSGFHALAQLRRQRAVYYFQISLGLLPALGIAALLGHGACPLVPPHFVTYASFCNEHSSFTRYPVQTWLQMGLGFAMGTAVQWLAAQCYAMPIPEMAAHGLYAMAAGLNMLAFYAASKPFHRVFPPAASLAATPFLIGSHGWALALVPAMAGYFIAVAWIMRAHPAYKNKDLPYL